MKKILLFLTTITLFCLCNKSDEKEEPNHYLGKWKLMSVVLYGEYLPFDIPSIDFSEAGIIYEFKTDGVMAVSGEMTRLDLDWYVEQGLRDWYLDYEIGTGAHLYAVTRNCNTCWWSLKVGDKDYGLFVSEDMSLMNIVKGIPFKDLPWTNITTRTSPSPLVRFESYLVKIEE